MRHQFLNSEFDCFLNSKLRVSRAQGLLDTPLDIVKRKGSKMRTEVVRIDYEADGQTAQVLTAAGPAVSYLVRLDEVEVGGILVKGVDAAIVDGGYPAEILLGMSFLRSVGFSERAGVLTLTQDF